MLRQRGPGTSVQVDSSLPDMQKEEKDLKQAPVSVVSTLVYLFLGGGLVLAAILAFLLLTRNNLPTPLGFDADPTIFSEARAYADLKALTGGAGIGRRLVGTKWNDEMAVALITERVNAIRDEPCTNPQGCALLEVLVQNITGSFPFFFIDRHIHNVYSNITNIAVRVLPVEPENLNNGLLINSHFDSAISAPGASDAGACIAVMIESLRAMKQSPPPRHPVVYLFNGAEESLQQGSHAFSAHHPWRKSVNSVLNLDSAGMHFVTVLLLIPPSLFIHSFLFISLFISLSLCLSRYRSFCLPFFLFE